MWKIAVTGGIACGKSTVGEYLAAAGVAVCDSDTLAREALEPGRPAFRRVVAAFGRGVLASDGGLNRRILARKVFRDAAARRRLNGLVHPEVKRRWRRWLAAREAESRGRRGKGQRKTVAAAVLVPLLFEVGAERGWDAMVCVQASPAVQMRRLRARGVSRRESLQRIRSQMPVAEKARRSDYVIDNSGSRSLLREQTRRVLHSILENRHGT